MALRMPSTRRGQVPSSFGSFRKSAAVPPGRLEPKRLSDVAEQADGLAGEIEDDRQNVIAGAASITRSGFGRSRHCQGHCTNEKNHDRRRLELSHPCSPFNLDSGARPICPFLEGAYPRRQRLVRSEVWRLPSRHTQLSKVARSRSGTGGGNRDGCRFSRDGKDSELALQKPRVADELRADL